ncbi:MAG: FliH/SctL family protein [Paracoccaceae bacterium]|nr:FliH/SctL family protein [Paracoccaceae bacterium]
MIDELDKTSDSSLADNEIASLMKTLSSNKYQGNSAFPRKVVEPFKALPLTQIASKAAGKNDSEVSKTEETNNKSSDQSNSEDEKVATDVNVPLKDNIPADEQKDSYEGEDSGQSTSPISPEDQNLESSTEGDDAPNSNNSEKQELPDQANNHTTGVPIKEKLYTETEKEEAYQKGLAEATKKFESEQASLQNKALLTLNNLIKKLETKIAIDTKLLEKQLKEEILKIATERVGTAIKEMPEFFTKKIEKLTQGIKNKGDVWILKLNSDDFQAIGSLLKNSKDLKNFTIFPDDTLGHSDIIIELGGVSLIDSISDRYDSNGKEGTRHLELDNSTENTGSKPESEAIEGNTDTNLTPTLENVADETEESGNQSIDQKKSIVKEDPVVSPDPNLESSMPLSEPGFDQKEKADKTSPIEEDEKNVEDLGPENENHKNDQ